MKAPLAILTMSQFLKRVFDQCPTVILLILQESIAEASLSPVVDKCVDIGAVAIAIAGSHANEVEDMVDYLVEERLGFDCDILTTAHSDQKLDEIIHYCQYSAYLGAHEGRYFVVFDPLVISEAEINAATLIGGVNE